MLVECERERGERERGIEREEDRVTHTHARGWGKGRELGGWRGARSSQRAHNIDSLKTAALTNGIHIALVV